jgi:hypothetical protein
VYVAVVVLPCFSSKTLLPALWNTVVVPPAVRLLHIPGETEH